MRKNNEKTDKNRCIRYLYHILFSGKNILHFVYRTDSFYNEETMLIDRIIGYTFPDDVLLIPRKEYDKLLRDACLLRMKLESKRYGRCWEGKVSMSDYIMPIRNPIHSPSRCLPDQQIGLQERTFTNKAIKDFINYLSGTDKHPKNAVVNTSEMDSKVLSTYSVSKKLTIKHVNMIGMKHSELRPGNFVKHGEKVIRIESIFVDSQPCGWFPCVRSGACCYDLSYLSPIDIDEDWLYRFGFITKKEWSSKAGYTYYKDDCQFIIEYQKGERQYLITDGKNNLHNIAYFVKFVHELQNVYKDISGKV